MDHHLSTPPKNIETRELWMENAAGFIIMEDIMKYAISRIPDGTDQETRVKIKAGIEDAIYGLCMMMDGVSGTLQNDEYSLRIQHKILLEYKDSTLEEIDTLDGDGMCMGLHSWLEGDFGNEPIVETENTDN